MSSALLAPRYRTDKQRTDALARANWVRARRKDRKQELRSLAAPAARRVAVGWMAVPPDELRTMTIFALLLACPTVGRVKANRIIRSAGVSPTRTLGGLTERQLHALADALDVDRDIETLPGQLSFAA